MKKKIIVESCSECPFLIHKDYSGIFESFYCNKSSRNVNKKKVGLINKLFSKLV